MLPKRTTTACAIALGIAVVCSSAVAAAQPRPAAKTPAKVGAEADANDADAGKAKPAKDTAGGQETPAPDQPAPAEGKQSPAAEDPSAAPPSEPDSVATEPVEPQPVAAEESPAEEAPEEAATTSPDDPEDDEESDEERELREENHPRPPLSDVDLPNPPSWKRHLELGADIAVVVRPSADGLGASQTGYRAAVGWGLHMNWPVLPWLRVRPYFIDAHHGLDIPQGSLTTSAANSISAAAELSETTAESFVFGAKLAPTLDITDRFRVWLSAGIGWGRYEFQEQTITEPGGEAFRLRQRAGTFLEFPVGIGIQVDVWPRWLAIEYEASVAPITGQSGSAYEAAQSLDDGGMLRDVGPFGAVDLSIVQTLGLSLIL